VLCLADGEGRNGVWLARQGMQVLAVDVSERGLRKARELAQKVQVTIETAVADVTRFDLGTARWDAIVSIFLHLPAKARRALHGRCLAAMKPGGVFIYEAYGCEQLRFDTGGPKEIELLPTLDDVLDELRGLAVEHQFAGTREVQEGRLHRGEGYVVQVVARKDAS
jgi:SAM-dependent methyltransferase